jgi:hypothetical protein
MCSTRLSTHTSPANDALTHVSGWNRVGLAIKSLCESTRIDSLRLIGGSGLSLGRETSPRAGRNGQVAEDRLMKAMLQMSKLDIAALEKAYGPR